MKYLCAILLSFVVTSSSNGIWGTYKLVDEVSFDTLEIRKDGTYTYKDRGDSCWTWHDFSGNWMLDKDELILFQTIKYLDSGSDIHADIFSISTDSVKVFVQSIDQTPIAGFLINYKSSAYGEPTRSGKTDENGVIRFKKHDIVYNENDYVYIEMKYLEHGREVSSRSSHDRNADRIIVTLNSKPDSVTKFRKHKFVLREDHLISTESDLILPGNKYIKL